MSDAIYSIGAVARMLGVPTATIRTWEERYAVVVPERSPGGHRLYTRDQVGQLRFVLRNIERGLQPADAHRLLADRLVQGPDWNLEGSGSETRLVIMLAEHDPYAAEFAEYFLRTEGYETILVLEANGYREVSVSVALPPLTGEDLARFIDEYRSRRWTDWLRGVRAWARARQSDDATTG